MTMEQAEMYMERVRAAAERLVIDAHYEPDLIVLGPGGIADLKRLEQAVAAAEVAPICETVPVKSEEQAPEGDLVFFYAFSDSGIGQDWGRFPADYGMKLARAALGIDQIVRTARAELSMQKAIEMAAKQEGVNPADLCTALLAVGIGNAWKALHDL